MSVSKTTSILLALGLSASQEIVLDGYAGDCSDVSNPSFGRLYTDCGDGCLLYFKNDYADELGTGKVDWESQGGIYRTYNWDYSDYCESWDRDCIRAGYFCYGDQGCQQALAASNCQRQTECLAIVLCGGDTECYEKVDDLVSPDYYFPYEPDPYYGGYYGGYYSSPYSEPYESYYYGYYQESRKELKSKKPYSGLFHDEAKFHDKAKQLFNQRKAFGENLSHYYSTCLYGGDVGSYDCCEQYGLGCDVEPEYAPAIRTSILLYGSKKSQATSVYCDHNHLYSFSYTNVWSTSDDDAADNFSVTTQPMEGIGTLCWNSEGAGDYSTLGYEEELNTGSDTFGVLTCGYYAIYYWDGVGDLYFEIQSNYGFIAQQMLGIYLLMLISGGIV